MKKIVIIFLLFTCSNNLFSQNFSYGPILGGNFNDITLEDGGLVEGGANGGGVSVGFFGDYQLSESIGVKTNIIFNSFFEESFYDTMRGQFSYRLFDRTIISSVQLQNFLKYDLNGNYNKGLYLLGGFNLANMIRKKPRKDDDVIDDFYKNMAFGVLGGFGTSISNNLHLELMANLGLTDVLKSDLENSKSFGVYLNFSYSIK